MLIAYLGLGFAGLFVTYLVVKSVREGIRLSKQDDIDAYVQTNYERAPHGDMRLRIYGPSPFGLWLAHWLKARRV